MRGKTDGRLFGGACWGWELSAHAHRQPEKVQAAISPRDVGKSPAGTSAGWRVDKTLLGHTNIYFRKKKNRGKKKANICVC